MKSQDVDDAAAAVQYTKLKRGASDLDRQKQNFVDLLTLLKEHLDKVGIGLAWAAPDERHLVEITSPIGSIRVKHLPVADPDRTLGGTVFFYDEHPFTGEVRQLISVRLTNDEQWKFGDGTSWKMEFDELTAAGMADALERALAQKLRLNTAIVTN